MDLSTAHLRLLAEVAEAGSLSAAAERLGYTQSAVSRQAVILERSVGATIFERRSDGVRLTGKGEVLLRHAREVLSTLAEAAAELAEPGARTPVVRVGAIMSFAPVLIPVALRRLADRGSGVRVTTREGSTPSLVRALRAGSIDLAVVTSRPPHRPLDQDSPGLTRTTLFDTELVIAVAEQGRYGRRSEIDVAELVDVDWITSTTTGSEPLLGVWPGLPGRPHVAHAARDWLTKLRLVAGGFGVTTVPPEMRTVFPDGIRLLPVTGAPPEVRRIAAARLPGPLPPSVAAVIDALR